jgi:hypothetical protein
VQRIVTRDCKVPPFRLEVMRPRSSSGHSYGLPVEVASNARAHLIHYPWQCEHVRFQSMSAALWCQLAENVEGCPRLRAFRNFCHGSGHFAEQEMRSGTVAPRNSTGTPVVKGWRHRADSSIACRLTRVPFAGHCQF